MKRERFGRTAMLAGVVAACGAAGCSSDDAPDEGDDASALVELEDGPVEGDVVGGARRFLKIPFAKPPVGDLRFRAPERNARWTGVRHETEFASSCPQLADQGAPASNEEDCLYLNVWAPLARTERAPVMLWIHGGGNFSGGAGIPVPGSEQLWYDGQVFAERQGVVLITIQYRLGPFGFFAHPALAAEGEPSGNQGLLDQRLALEWVKRNAAKFGGDPSNVTLFGESAGAGNVCYHLVSPGSRGLFHRAIGQSGGCTMRSGVETAAAVGDSMVAYAAAVGCEAGPAQLDCLRGKTVEEMLAHGQQPAPGGGEIRSADWSFAVVVDGEDGFLPRAPRAAFDVGDVASVPYLLGSNNDEGTTFVWSAPPLLSEEEYLADLNKRYPNAGSDVAALYPPSDFGGDFNQARARAVGDSSVVCGTHDTARRAAKAGLDVFLYNFNVPWSLAPALLKAGHAAEMSHVFGNPLPGEAPDPESQRVADAMNAYWARFAATGDPNGADAPAEWPIFATDADERLQLDPGFEVITDFRAEECAFWRRYSGAD